MANGLDDAPAQHWPAGLALIAVGLVVAVATTHRRSAPAGTVQLTVLLGLLTATALSGVGAGLMSTGGLTPGGWGPFALAAATVLGPLVLARLRPGTRPAAVHLRTGPDQSCRRSSPAGREEAGRGVSH